MNTDHSSSSPKWHVLSQDAFNDRLEASMRRDADWLQNTFPAIGEFLSEIDEELLDDSELEILYFLASRVIAVCLPEGLDAPKLTADDLWESSGTLLNETEAWCESGMELEDVPEAISKQSVQPEAIDFALTLLMEIPDGDNARVQGFEVRVESIIPMIIQLEAMMRCLKQNLT